MSKQQYYAVTRGRTTGLFTDWVSCCESIEDIPDSNYRVFYSLKEAQSYLQSKNIIYKDIDIFLNELKSKYNVPKSAGIDSLAWALTGGVYYAGLYSKEVFTDGACTNNHKSTGIRAAIGVYFGKGDSRNRSTKVPITLKQTNQAAELYAIYEALKLIINSLISDSFEITYDILTDSRYAIGCITEWYQNWIVNGWKNEQGKQVENQELIQDTVLLYDLVNAIHENMGCYKINIRHVKAHAGYYGNEMANHFAETALSSTSTELDDQHPDEDIRSISENGTQQNGTGIIEVEKKVPNGKPMSEMKEINEYSKGKANVVEKSRGGGSLGKVGSLIYFILKLILYLGILYLLIIFFFALHIVRTEGIPKIVEQHGID